MDTQLHARRGYSNCSGANSEFLTLNMKMLEDYSINSVQMINRNKSCFLMYEKT
ncbi:hypothetical protein RND71_030628 [Anisodus tanguticus]|uniref:Uncharacterized protein n=1 Tax=Anisodus tanguticus TaxID=243964 RepID=A0AAE1RGS6_9SOLA|nr:hypothetical protein RND71_030628 [Anisodus tanguticus]